MSNHMSTLDTALQIQNSNCSSFELRTMSSIVGLQRPYSGSMNKFTHVLRVYENMLSCTLKEPSQRQRRLPTRPDETLVDPSYSPSSALLRSLAPRAQAYYANRTRFLGSPKIIDPLYCNLLRPRAKNITFVGSFWFCYHKKTKELLRI